MTESRISVTRAARTFSDLLNWVCYRREAFVIERGGEPVCGVVPARAPARTPGERVRLLCSMPKPDAAYGDAVGGS
ncbi:MAG: hypothetical protein HYV62_05745 [Candidatus Rokubacteria bacterium]|nr:hypothetical protein [Candidatus Rokubacteria bacterium]